MLAFITTLRHPHNSADYGHVESLLQDTLASLVQQSSDDYIVIVVGNRRPAFRLPERCVFVEVDFPPPSTRHGPRTGPAAVIWDKGTKTAIGLIAAREFAPDYVMAVDADDFVHRDVAAFVNARPGRDGWWVEQGWMYSRRRNACRLQRKFHHQCGTSLIVRYDAFDVPPDLTISSTQREIFEAFGERFEHILEHGWALAWWQNHGLVMEPLPFAAAVYHVGHGENHCDNGLFGFARPYHARLHDDFAINPSRTPRSTLWASYGLPALRPDLRLPRPAFLQPKSYLANYSPPDRAEFGATASKLTRTQ
ncbi:glycosyltransferase family A protein [Mycobacterium conspicuum]|jgi:hypothetical protein|uniref:Uncharacterized protein n=1 Tax=Mycobacterium conspicuum TaxID=44010 RepID=A0A1X1TPG8_9MYCO|nr:glycosyltransferase family A protein [Mycobacterium conspicuum]ORV46359.1 hypothetical protein AWC00_03850 [Mycobacterium conspicuum]BBZ41205.1 hypothetical protein MCNS_42680 [Mycobacterium conspicuum]